MDFSGGVHVVRRGLLSFAISAPLAACVAAAPVPAPRAPVAAQMQPAAGGGIRVSRTDGTRYATWDGAPARRDADALCGRAGVRASIYDRHEAGAWVFVKGCA